MHEQATTAPLPEPPLNDAFGKSKRYSSKYESNPFTKEKSVRVQWDRWSANLTYGEGDKARSNELGQALTAFGVGVALAFAPRNRRAVQGQRLPPVSPAAPWCNTTSRPTNSSPSTSASPARGREESHELRTSRPPSRHGTISFQ